MANFDNLCGGGFGGRSAQNRRSNDRGRAEQLNNIATAP
jgi:hypothetical protein